MQSVFCSPHFVFCILYSGFLILHFVCVSNADGGFWPGWPEHNAVQFISSGAGGAGQDAAGQVGAWGAGEIWQQKAAGVAEAVIDCPIVDLSTIVQVL